MIAQVLRATPATISASFFVDGTIADPGVVTITVTTLDGTALYSDAATTGSGAAARTLSLTTSDTARPDTLTCVWTSPTLGDITTTVEIVGDLLFTEVDARAFDNAAMASETSYPDADIHWYRAMISEAFEQRLGTSMFPRFTRAIIDGDGSRSVIAPDIRITALRAAAIRETGTATWTALTAAELADTYLRPGGIIYRESLGVWTAGVENVRLDYEYGRARVPLEINRAALLVLRDTMVASNIDDRATSFADEFGNRTFVIQAGIRGALYSLPEVNAILNEYREKVPVIG